jgi:Family of unknown function (DUF5641)
MKTVSTKDWTYKELHSVLWQMKGKINRCPLLVNYNCDNKTKMITHHHILTGRRFMSLDTGLHTENKLSQYKVMPKMTKWFWKKWRSDYVKNDYPTKPGSVQEEIKVGDVVILKEEKLKRHDWPI